MNSRGTAIIVLAAVILAVSGYVNGVLTRRWDDPIDSAAVTARLAQLPAQIGDYTSEEGRPLKDYELKVGEIQGFLSRVYHSPNGRRFDLLIVFGAAGPIALHPPTVCFTGAGLVMDREPISVPVPTSGADRPDKIEFWETVFSGNNDGSPFRMRTYWGWSTAGIWKAATSPRTQFAGEPVLFKMYITTQESPPAEGDEDVTRTATADFLKVLVPELEKVMAGAAKSTKVATATAMVTVSGNSGERGMSIP